MNAFFAKIRDYLANGLLNLAVAIRRPAPSDTKLVDLAPTDEADAAGVYAAALRYAIENTEISNIALTGPYGSGKSSIIKSFLKSYPRRALHISLAAFLPETGDLQHKVSKQEIERSILQQLLYGADAEDLPLSRFKRIKSPGRWAPLRSFYIVIGLFSLWHVFHNRNSIFEGSYFTPFDLSNWQSISLGVFASTFLWSTIHHFYVASFGLSLKSISLKDIEMRPNAADQDSILNRHLDEIIYFFQSTAYDLVVVEDLDRFETADIFVTLREINSLVNSNSGVKRQISFLYALRDDVFVNTERTKFFEFIIPVVPIINSSNSIDMMIAQGKRLELTRGFDRQFLREVSRYLNDLRLIHNIFNEYAIYLANLETSGESVLDPTKLLAVLIYKNVYPRDFEFLHKSEGYLAEILARKDELIAAQEHSCRKQITELENGIEAAAREVARDLQELRRIYSMALIEMLPDDFVAVGVNQHQTIALKSLPSHSAFDDIITAQRVYCRHPNGYHQWIDIPTQPTRVTSHASYAERSQAIERKADAYKMAIQRDIAQLREEIKTIRTSKFHVLLRSDPKEAESLFHALGTGGDLARFLLLEGYLDDSYYQYTSLFHSGRLSPNDNKFLIKIRSFHTPAPLFPIDTPSEVIAAMREEDFSLAYALNVRIVDTLLATTEHQNLLRKVFIFLSIDFNDQQDFFEAYYENGAHPAEFLMQLTHAWPGFIPDIIRSSSAIRHIASLIEHLTSAALANQGSIHPEFRVFVAENLRDILDLLPGADPAKLKHLQIEATDLSAIDAYPNVTRHLYEAGHYRLNQENFEYIFGSILGMENGTALQKQHYTIIRNSSEKLLINRVNNDFLTYFENVLMDTTANDEEDTDAILAVMSHDEISEEKLTPFILRQVTLLPSIDNVPARFWPLVVREAKLVPTWSNCLAFVQAECFDKDALINYLKYDGTRETLLAIPLPETKEFVPLCRFLINAEELDDEAYRAYVEAIPFKFSKFPRSISISKRRIIIDAKCITFNAENLAELDDDAKLKISFVARNIAAYLDAPDSFPVDDDLREGLLSTDITIDQKASVLSSMDLSTLPSVPERAALIGSLFVRMNGALPVLTPENIKSVIIHSRPTDTQIYLLNRMHVTLDNAGVREVLGQLPEPYSKIQTGYASPVLIRTVENSKLVEWLAKRNLISSVGKSFLSGDIKVNLYRS